MGNLPHSRLVSPLYAMPLYKNRRMGAHNPWVFLHYCCDAALLSTCTFGIIQSKWKVRKLRKVEWAQNEQKGSFSRGAAKKGGRAMKTKQS